MGSHQCQCRPRKRSGSVNHVLGGWTILLTFMCHPACPVPICSLGSAKVPCVRVHCLPLIRKRCPSLTCPNRTPNNGTELTVAAPSAFDWSGFIFKFQSFQSFQSAPQKLSRGEIQCLKISQPRTIPSPIKSVPRNSQVNSRHIRSRHFLRSV